MTTRLIIALAVLLVASCGEFDLPGGGKGTGALGYYKETPPPEGRLGLFIERQPAPPAVNQTAPK